MPSESSPDSTNGSGYEPEWYRGARLYLGPTYGRLNQKQLVDYREHRKRLIDWMADRGKDTRHVEGYAETTRAKRANRLDAYYRWVWDEFDGYTTAITHDHGHAYVDHLVTKDVSGTHKTNTVKTLRMYYRWREDAFGDESWETDVTFRSGQHDNPRDYLTRTERRQIREAALEYGSVPHYNSVGPQERRQWTAHLARRFGKPSKEIGKADFERANGHKFASLVCVSLDAGLRPIEVERARTSWVDVDNDTLRIPAKQSAKNRDNWTVAIQSRTSVLLDKWLQERRLYEKYDDTDRLWLTREGNPYQSTSLKYLLHNLCDEAGIETDGRQMTWYALRHALGSYMTREEDLAVTRAQLRHRSIQTTMKYDQAPVEDRRNALNRME